MKKLVTALCVLCSFSLSAQTLFYYGKDSVTVNEFLRAYHKNNTGPKTEKAFRDYLQLYIASRLKIREAVAQGYDTLPQIVADLESLRQQILPNYLNDKESMNRLVDEAYSRSQKDIHLAHIFIGYSQNGTDSVAAQKKLSLVQAGLKNGTAFPELARKYSDDPSAKQNGGDLGYITAFSLPYELENLAYSTPVGQTSAVYRSKAGYHLFRNLGERKDPGRMKVAQILLAFPPDAIDQTKAEMKKLADSLFNRLLKGEDFALTAARYSNDVISAQANGQVPDFGIGQYDQEFEEAAYALPKDGAISKPFLTTHGYHILKRLGRVPAVGAKTDAKAMQLLKERVEASDRINTTKAALAQKILKTVNYNRSDFADKDLWIYSDSILNFKAASPHPTVAATTTLFRLGDRNVTTNDWISYAQTFRYKPDGSGIKPYPQIWEEFQQAMALDFYQNHLEQFNEEFRQQLAEFKEGNLFFEIMQRQVWGPAQSDSTALEDYYNKNRSKYTWTHSADAVIFYASDAGIAKTFITQLKREPANWHELVNSFSEKIAADSSRFEWSQLPGAGATAKAGSITEPVINKADNTTSFAYILHTYNQPSQRSFTEAKGLVINDYQAALEKSWLTRLEKKYPVRVNEKMVKSMSK